MMRTPVLVCAFFAVMLAAAAQAAYAASAVVRDFDGPELSWQLGDGRPGARVVSHGCDGDDARQGTRSERIVIAAPLGESLHFICPVGRVPVLDELETRLWVKASRPGVTLAARVVLPRSNRPEANTLRTVLVPGSECAAAGRWRQLKLSDMPKLLEAQSRILRMAPGTKIDTREAYVDAIVLIVPGGDGGTVVWTDALEVDGIVLPAVAESGESARVAPAVVIAAAHSVVQPSAQAMAASPVAAETPSIRFQGTMLMVADKPFLPLGVEWNNEPLEYLAARGCNTIWTEEPPSHELSEEAAKAGVWLVCRPPSPDSVADGGLGADLRRVLAWNLGGPAGSQELDYYRRWAEIVRDRDPLSSRPIVMMPRGDWLPASRLADALVADHAASSRLASTDFTEWLQGVSRLTRPGTPLWTCIPTQPGDRSRRQAAALAHAKSPPAGVLDDAQFESLVLAAVVSGCRGFVFQSDSPLDAADDVTKRRAVLLEALNRQLDLLEPWLTAGKRIGVATSTDATVTAVVLQVERARMLIPTSWNLESKGDRASSKVTFVVPGIPESNEVFLLTGAKLERLVAKRVAGGMRVALDRNQRGLILMTEDPAIIASFQQRVARGARRNAQLQYSLASTRAQALAGIAPQLSRLGVNTKRIDKAIGAASPDVVQANSQLTTGNFDASYRHSSSARQVLADALTQQWLADAEAPPFDSTPFSSAHDALLPRAEFARSRAQRHDGENLLIGGDCEDLGQLRHFGWRHVNDPLAGVETHVELSGVAPREGRYCLELSAKVEPAATTPEIVSRPLVWIVSPPVRVTNGDIVEITGWVRIAEPIQGSIDGLKIVDSLGGQELAIRVRQTDDWQPFRMIRAAEETTDATVTLALHGIGTARVDGMMVRALAAPSARRLPAAESRSGPAFPSEARRSMFSPPPVR